MVREFINAWQKMDEFIESLNVNPVIFHVDRQDIKELAPLVGVEFKPIVEREQSAHYICDEWIQPVKERFPQEIQDIAKRWGY